MGLSHVKNVPANPMKGKTAATKATYSNPYW